MTDIVVVGAGVAGAMAARELALDHDVVLVDRSGIAAGTTGLSAGVVAPTLFYGDLPGVAHHANDFFRAFDGTGPFEFTERDRLDVLTEAQVPAARDTAARRADEEFPVTYLPAATVVERYPAFSLEGFAGAVEYRDTGWVDPYAFATALVDDAVQRGAAVEPDVAVTEILVEDGDVTGVATDAGEIRAGTVIVAAGWRTPALLDDHLALPVRPFRTQVVVLEAAEPLDAAFPIVRVGSEHLYLRPEHNGDLLIGGGAQLVDDPSRASEHADEAFQQHVADALPRLLTGFDAAGVVADWAGVDAATPDARPIVDAPTDGPAGLVVATGFNGLGVMVSPAAGAAVRSLVTGDAPPFDLDAFTLDRFDDRSAEFELSSTSAV